jgi:hypothetical protein
MWGHIYENFTKVSMYSLINNFLVSDVIFIGMSLQWIKCIYDANMHTDTLKIVCLLLDPTYTDSLYLSTKTTWVRYSLFVAR